MAGQMITRSFSGEHQACASQPVRPTIGGHLKPNMSLPAQGADEGETQDEAENDDMVKRAKDLEKKIEELEESDDKWAQLLSERNEEIGDFRKKNKELPSFV